MKRILFFTCEPGGAEVLAPIIQKMKKDGQYEIITLCYGYAIERLQNKKINFQEIQPIKQDDHTFMESYKPDYVITSATSLPQKDMSEKFLWHLAKQKGIPSIAFLDQWQNYAIRFSGLLEEEYLLYQPDIINCINELGKTEMLKLGFEPDKLSTLGQPYLSQLKNHSYDKEKTYKELNLSRTKEMVLFVSEAIEENYGQSRGYTQYDTLKYLTQDNNFLKNKQLIVKLHPKDNIAKFSQFKNILFIHNQYSALETILIADYVIGMTSIMLIESYILEKPTLSIQLSSKEDLLLLSKEKFIYSINDSKHILHKNDFVRKHTLEYDFDYKGFKKLLASL